MHKGQYIHMANLQRENHELKSVNTPPPVMKNDHEVSMLKLRILEMQETIRKKDDEIDRLFRLMNNY